MMLIVAAMLPFGHVKASDWSPPRTVFIPESGQTIDGVFLDYWRSNAGFVNFGYPITPEHQFNGRVVQYFTYARFEYWPDDPDGEIVKLGNIGQELRPTLVPRQLAAGAAAKSKAAGEVEAMQRAWLPLSKEEAGRPNTPTWRFVPETKHSVANGFKAWWETTGEGYLGNPLTEEYVQDGTTYQVFERGQLAWTKENGVWMVPLGHVLAERYGISTDPVHSSDVPVYAEALFIAPMHADPTGAPPPPAGEPKALVVSLSQQKMWAYENETVVMSSLVSTGKPEFETPPGSYRIIVKKEIEDMEGLAGGEYYNVPQVPDVMYFTNEGHAFHGTYWHNNFGQVMSHGCVNLPLDIAEWLYDWTPMGTAVVIVP
jgi:hypothetical protein